MDWKKLQNGSDIRGVALDGIEGESVNLTNEVTTALAQAFVAWLGEKNGKTVQRYLALVWHLRQQCLWQR